MLNKKKMAWEALAVELLENKILAFEEMKGILLKFGVQESELNFI